MHHFLVFAIFNHSVAVLTLNALKLVEQFAQFFQCEVVGPSLVLPHVEVFFQFWIAHALRCKSKLSQVIPAVVSKVQNSPCRQLIVDLRNNFFEVFGGDSWKNEYKYSKLGSLTWEGNLLIDEVAAFCVYEFFFVKDVFLHEVYRMLCKIAALHF